MKLKCCFKSSKSRFIKLTGAVLVMCICGLKLLKPQQVPNEQCIIDGLHAGWSQPCFWYVSWPLRGSSLSPFWNLPLYYEIRCWNMYVGFLGPSISIRMLSMTLVTLSATVKKPYMVSPSNYDLVGHPHHPLTIHEMVPTAIWDFPIGW